MIFLELVPRDLDTLLKEAQVSLSTFNAIYGINVPDVKRLPIRSILASAMLLENNIPNMPHIRCMDYSLNEHISHISRLVDAGLTHVLLVTGDPIHNQQSSPNHVHPTAMCTALKRKFPKLHVYCALDPYRQSIQAELRYAQEKINAGADGLFTQPFFDEKLAKIYCEQLAHTTLFVGIAPVLSIQSYQYWVDVNKVVFPACFNNSLEYNCTLAKNIIALATKEGQHSYIMPIKTDIMAYLSGIFTT